MLRPGLSIRVLVKRWLPLATGVGGWGGRVAPVKCCRFPPVPPVPTLDEWQGLVLKMQDNQEESRDALDSGAGRGSRQTSSRTTVSTHFL